MIVWILAEGMLLYNKLNYTILNNTKLKQKGNSYQ